MIKIIKRMQEEETWRHCVCTQMISQSSALEVKHTTLSEHCFHFHPVFVLVVVVVVVFVVVLAEEH